MEFGNSWRISHEKTPLTIRAGVAERPKYGEDCYIFDDQLKMFAVLDGVGGVADGRLAAQTARDAIHSYVQYMNPTTQVETESVLQGSFNLAREELAQSGCKGHTTANVSLVINTDNGDKLVTNNAGDSRTILWRNGVLRDITQE